MTISFGYTIVYVADVTAIVAFYERAFGLERRFVTEEGGYAEMDTGATTLAFASHDLGGGNIPAGYIPLDPHAPPVGIEIGLVTPDVVEVYERAVAAGAEPLAAPKTKPWGQVVGYVRDPAGTLIEICSPMG